MAGAEPELEQTGEHEVTRLELFFDLVFVFAITQVTSLLAHDPTWHRVLRVMLVLAALWLDGNGYAWLTSALDVDEGAVRLAMLVMAAMLITALAVPHSFGTDAVLFAAAYVAVRVAVALCGGAALYLLAHIAFLFRTIGYVFRRRTVAAAALLALISAAVAVPALAALGLVSAVCTLVVAYEAIRYPAARFRLRHPELAG